MDEQRLDLEGELRAGRSRTRDEFAAALAGEVRGASARARQSRLGMRLAVAGLAVVAVASFGGIGYAGTHNAADSQYATPQSPIVKPQATTFTPPTVKQTKATTVKVTPQHLQGASGTEGNVAQKASSGQLPFTGLALWIPLAGGLALIAFGLTLRTRAKRRSSPAL